MEHPTILACTDGSVYAQSVYDHAAWAASRINAHIRVLHLIDARS
ncbi:MAG: universal stress protein, partial [Opitutales bacterium]